MATPPALARISGGPSDAAERPDLSWLRASGLAQARLQLAVLSGNRRRALEQIDRLMGIDRQLERLARGANIPIASTLVKTGVSYPNASERVREALASYTRQVSTNIPPAAFAFRLVGSGLSRGLSGP